MKAQSLKFISNPNEFQSGVKSVFWVLLIFAAIHFRLKKKIVIVNSVAYIWAFIQISSVVYSEICMQTRSSGVSSNISAASSPSLRDVYKPDHGLVPFIVFPTLRPQGFLLCFLGLDHNSGF